MKLRHSGKSAAIPNVMIGIDQDVDPEPLARFEIYFESVSVIVSAQIAPCTTISDDDPTGRRIVGF